MSTKDTLAAKLAPSVPSGLSGKKPSDQCVHVRHRRVSLIPP